MAAGSSMNDGSSGGNGQKEMIPIKITIQHIKEIVKDHSEADIYAALEESHMDANETAQKLLAQDPFHEVKRRRDRKKESVGPRSYIINNRRLAGDDGQWVKSRTWGENFQKGTYTRNSSAGQTFSNARVNKEFRVVRDNRLNQNVSKDAKQEKVQHLTSSSYQTLPNVSDGRARTEGKHSGSLNSDQSLLSAGPSMLGNGPLQAKDDSSGITRNPLTHEEKQATGCSSKRQQSDNSSQIHSKGPNNSVIGVYSSSLDPVHVPSPNSRSAGTVGAIRREVGVVGGRKLSSDRLSTRSSVSTSPFSVSLSVKSISSQAESSSHTAITSKSNQSNQAAPLVPLLPNASLGRSNQSNHYNSKLHQSAASHQKAIQSNMEWKPKSISKPSNAIPDDGRKGSVSPSRVDNSCRLNGNVCGLSEELSEVSLVENKHVSIPQHLVVPESEIIGLTFGSFGAEIIKAIVPTSTFLQTSEAERLTNQPSISLSASLSVNNNADAIVAQHDDTGEGHDRAFMSDSAVSAVEFEHAPANEDIISSQNLESYADIGLIQSNSPFSSAEENQLQNDSNLSSFSQVYNNQTNYDAPFLRTAIDDNAFSARAVSSGPLPTLGMAQAQAQAQAQPVQQQQAVGQVYPQVPIPHYSNFVPFRHMFSPVYVPQMAMPNYSTNPGYPHPSNGNSYLVMPGGSSHLNASNVKYATSQYKPIPASVATGYGNYSNPAGFTINAPGSVSTATGLDELNRIKYKDSNLYVPNPQADASDMWVQTPRELSGLQSAPYYNIPGQTPHAAAFMPAHTGHAYNAAGQTQHVQYPGLYHPQQPASMPNHHPHLMHQQVPSAAMGGGVGMAAPGGQVGTYQQPQLGHLNWTANF